MKRSLVLGLFLLGCSDPNVLANIDTLTCAYLPSLVDCTSQEVHDKAISILQTGLVSARAFCYFSIPYRKVVEYQGPEPYYSVLEGVYEVTKFQDGAVLTTCQVGGPINYYAGFSAGNLQHYSGSQFLHRGQHGAELNYCTIQPYLLNISPFIFTLSDGVIKVQKAGIYDTDTPNEYHDMYGNCTGLNLSSFE